MKNAGSLRRLNEDQYRVLYRGETEAPFTGRYVHHDEAGIYHCAGCGALLFESGAKFDSGSGWPSFFDVARGARVKLQEDASHGMIRTEVICATCGGHLGHVFDDAPQQPTGTRYCVNSLALEFEPATSTQKRGKDNARTGG